MIGRVLRERYELLELIGTGGMSKVYKARCRLLNRYVAVKVLKEEYNADKEFVKRFYIESQAAASLSSPNVVSIYDVGEENNTYYIVMEYVEGVTLKEVIKENGVLAWNVALNFTLQILSALECAHKNGIVHRDIKPQNIIVTDEGILKVTDFGIARAVNGDETKKIDRDVLGSVHYISPEQAKGIMIDARSDLYSLGIVMYEMLTGKLPYDGVNPVSVALMHLNSEPASIKDLNLSVPNELIKIVNKAMQRDVVNRYQRAKDMADELNEFKKAENLTTKENEDAFIAETIAMVQIAKQANMPQQETVREEEEGYEETKVTVKHTEKEEKSSKKKGNFWKDKKERTAVIAAISLSALIVALMVFIFVKVFFPGLDFSSLFASKEYLLPNVIDQNISEVQPMLEAEGLKVKINEVEDDSREDGLIINQHPSGNIMVKVRKTTVQLDVVKNDSEAQMVKIPKVVNKEYRQAKQELEKAGFSVRIVEEISEDIPVDFVIRQNPAANREAAKGTEVIIYVSKKTEETEVFVPNFVGMTEDLAKEKASEVGLVISFLEKPGTENVGKVVEQSIAKETLVAKNTTIRLTIITKAEDTVTPPPSQAPEQEHSKVLTIDLPTDRETVTVVVKKSGTEVYRRSHNTSEKRITVTVKGTGTQKVEVLQDGQQYFSQNITFN